MEKVVALYKNDTVVSSETSALAKRKLESGGFVVKDNFSDECELIISVGGDGATLDTIHRCNFPSVPIVGINTGHLGFFQEVDENTLDNFIFNYTHGNFCLQPLHTVEAILHMNSGSNKCIKALNEIVIRGGEYYSTHLNMSIGGSFIERYSGDGLLIATSAGSTAYNYSLGGSIVDPRLNLLQVTPIAPLNTTAYRSFTSSILLPSDLTLEIVPEYNRTSNMHIVADGIVESFDGIDSITVEVSPVIVNLVRFSSYDFWNKVKAKFL